MNKRRRFKAKLRRRNAFTRGADPTPSNFDQAWWLREIATWKKRYVIVRTVNMERSGGGYDHWMKPAAAGDH